MMTNDILGDIESLTTQEITPKVKVSVSSGKLDTAKIKEASKGQRLFVVKNISKNDIVCDWDNRLMPQELLPKFDKYLNEKYLQFDIPENIAKLKIVAVLVDGNRTINFLHQFMTEQKVPSLETVQVGREVVVKSQCVLPMEKMIVVTEAQMESLARFERKRMVTASGTSDWYGDLAVKEISDEDLKKLEYSYVTVEGIKDANFVSTKVDNNPLRKPVSYEGSEDLIEI